VPQPAPCADAVDARWQDVLGNTTSALDTPDITLDFTTVAPTLTAPVTGTRQTRTFDVNFSLPEAVRR
jgi:hypothetical protein